MQVDHRCFDTGMPHETLEGADNGAGFKEMRRERVAHGVASGASGCRPDFPFTGIQGADLQHTVALAGGEAQELSIFRANASRTVFIL